MTPRYKDASVPVEERVADLLGRMTTEEKLAQMQLRPARDLYAEISGTGVPKVDNGGIYANIGYKPGNIDLIQRYMVEKTRLGIPVLSMSESLHGAMLPGATVFPQAIGLGCTFNTALLAEMANTMGFEMRANGVRQTYAPNLDLSREPRWGRVEENYGEDPYLTSRMGVAYVRAVQAHGVACSPKHYVAHGSPEGGINLAPVHAGLREFYENYLPPFEAAIREGGALSVMPAYSELDGEAIHASRFLLTDVLRGRLGFRGFTVSDFGAVQMLHTFHKVAPTPKDAGRMTLHAGIDMEAPNAFGFCPDFAADVKSGKIPMDEVNEAVRRILRVKFVLGLFENPYSQPESLAQVHSDKAVALARRAAHESVVLLKNDGLLPLSDSVGRVAVIGPNADDPQLGDYTDKDAFSRAVTLRRGLEARLGADRVLFARGSGISRTDETSCAAAMEAARAADVIIVVLGDNSNYHGGIGWGDTEGGTVVTCGEGFDSSTLTLPACQQQLLESAVATGKPVVLVLETGRPYCIGWADAHVPAIVQAWYPGEQGGHALCDLLFGDVNPSGRLDISFPRSVGHVPCFYNHKVSARGFYKRPGSPQAPGRDYVFDTPAPLYPFGHGLSYTTFVYTDLSVTPACRPDGSVRVTVTVTNAGSRSGQETVLLYLSDDYCRIAPTVKRLRGFDKIHLEPGQARRVSFTLGREDFAFVNEAYEPEVEPGTFTVEVGGQRAQFEVR